MKLFHNPASPFVRKVMACAIARDLDRRITPVPTIPQQADAEFLAANPLSKIPCLITADGRALFDSPVICEYLDTIGDAPPMFPQAGGARWTALKQQALADGIMDATVLARGESLRPAEAARAANIARQFAAVDRALDQLESGLPHRTLDIGTISVACALGYLDFRFADRPWRATRPALAAWFQAMSASPALARTAPPVPA